MGASYRYDSSTNKLKNVGNSYSGGTSYGYRKGFTLEIYKIVGIK